MTPPNPKLLTLAGLSRRLDLDQRRVSRLQKIGVLTPDVTKGRFQYFYESRLETLRQAIQQPEVVA